LETRGYAVAGDTVRLRGELYVQGDGDRAAALFEFKATVEEAFFTMYQGSWLPHLPPRFAVLPVSEGNDPGIDMLAQAGLSILFYEVRDTEDPDAGNGRVAFIDLEAALATIARPSPA
jgi:hypothetical protein